MSQTTLLLENIRANQELKESFFEVDPIPLDYFDPDDSIEFHSGRILLLLGLCGSDKIIEGKVGIKGRTKLAKMDFFLRYPFYLDQVLDKLKVDRTKLAYELEESEKNSIEATMIRYKYGPWDQKYYDIFAYLLSKGLIEINVLGGTDYFSISNLGKTALRELTQAIAFQPLVNRCEVIKKVFGNRSGESIKNIIYTHFPEIVRKPIGSLITGIHYD